MSKTRNLSNSAPQFNALVVPVGTTAQRPSVTPGYIRFNTDLNVLESANNTAWANVGSGSASSSSGSGGVTWLPVQNTNFIAVGGNGYGVNTASGNVTVTLPASPTAGQQINLFDYASTFSANALIIYPNGNKLLGNTANTPVTTNGSSIGLVYYDSIRGWVAYNGFSTSPLGSYSVNYLIVAGGGAGPVVSGYGTGCGGGGGAGGLITGSSVFVPGTQYSVTVGAGGAGSSGASAFITGNNGANSSLGNLTAAVGGGGGGTGNPSNGSSGGSGGGGGYATVGGSGTSGQGNPGGNGNSTGNLSAGGGGGAGASGGAGTSGVSGNGGTGIASSITGSSVYYAGGGGGGGSNPPPSSSGGVAGSGGPGGGGPGGPYHSNGSNGTANSGGGGGSTGADSPSTSTLVAGNGGSGVVIISYFGPQRGIGGSISVASGYTIHTFTTSGTFTA